MSKVYGSPQLPPNFAEKLLDCEIEVELNENVSQEIVMFILQLYSKGMEYFESIKSYKYMYFQRKMNALIRCPKIVNLMKAHSAEGNHQTEHQKPESLDKSRNGSEKMKSIEISQKYQKMYNQLVGETSTLTGEKIKRLVAENQVKLTEVKASIKDQISEQEERLKIKIQRRKFVKETKKWLSAADLEKSTKDSLFSDGDPIQEEKQKMEADFSAVIQENQSDSEEDTSRSVNEKQQGGNLGKSKNEIGDGRQNREQKKEKT